MGPRVGRRVLLRAAGAGIVVAAAGTSVDAGPVAEATGASSSVGAAAYEQSNSTQDLTMHHMYLKAR